VLNDSCIVADDFRDAIHGCYDAYFSGVEDKKPFGVKNGTAYVPDDGLCSVTYSVISDSVGLYSSV